ncbi:PAS domain-containing protein [Limnoglobus roseus]|uniref:Hybrid sensor histidine kinase/response regulator n=1 Tax=Limnoglobus roseus TaxID=2598579 RepID=A0A5C1ADH3_9BACT|nr:PAS domain-containing protein [Limnoglobus roseus]QEL16750.1 hybrid sensor histidine kinase/response regulator [Limnoglobus roseus]
MNAESPHIVPPPPDGLYQLLVEAAVDYAIFALDPAGRVTSWNLGAERIKGYTASEILGQHFSNFYPPEARGRDLPARLLETARSTGRAEDEDWRVRKDGSRFWADVVITPLRGRGGELLGYGKVTRDRTEQRTAENDLRTNEERFRLLAEHARDVIFRFEYTPAPRYSYVSPAICDLIGYTPEELYLDPAAGFRVIHPDDQPRLAVLKTSGMDSDLWIEVRLVSRDGRTVWTEQRVTPVRDAGGELIAAEGIIRDITGRKRAEVELKAAKLAAEAALAQVKQLRGVLPICSYCNRIRDDSAFWHRVETYISAHTDARFAHGVCPACFDEVVKPQLEELGITEHE